jgi:choline dehydrogenase-like flavoprotein
VSNPRITSRPATYDADYIVVGSGAGGGTVAARLAESGFTVLLLEAGEDPRRSFGDNPANPQRNSLPDDYDVPAFHAQSSENSGMAWEFWVKHYDDPQQKKRDPNYRDTHKGKPVDGIFYPRAQRHDPRLPAQRGLGPDRRPHRRRLLARRQHATLLREDRALHAPRRRQAGGWQWGERKPARVERLAADRAGHA